MIGVDLFSGSGGMTLGAKWAGINVLYAVESDKYAAETYRHNNDDVILIEEDIKKIKSIPSSRSESLVVFGGPPCQGFSTSNQKTRTYSNTSNWLLLEFIRIIKSFSPLPEWIVFENVKGFSETENGIFLESIFQEFTDLGYALEYGILNAVEFGVPQKRSRFFAVGSIKKNKYKLPNPATSDHISVEDAFEDLPKVNFANSIASLEYKGEPQKAYASFTRAGSPICVNNELTRNSELVIERYEHVPQGGNWEDIPEHLMMNYKDRLRCHTGIYHRLKANEPSIVIGNYRKNMLIHPNENRGLTVREAARLQSFPDWYIFKGSIGFQQQQVGNAVPPLLAKAVFDSILKIDSISDVE